MLRQGCDAGEVPLHVMVAEHGQRRRHKGVVSHVHGGELPAGSLLKIDEGLYVADIRLCALQAAEDLEFVELIEYFYEICGAYSLDGAEGRGYRERLPLTSVSDLSSYFDQMAGVRGIRKASRALRYVRDGSRSPMETALVMMLTLPRADGGLGIRDVVMDHRIEVSGHVRDMTGRRYFVTDIYIRKVRLAIEYHGSEHERAARGVADEERENALRAMGHQVIVVRRGAFFSRLSFLRFMEAIRKRVGIRPSSLDPGFAKRQERLRRFVLRRVL
ncbi:MAG: hypothetical protein E7001_05160 [Coriobacteriaceae bacterium]|nr:hypothetical protein [Coriobacteriaceae bacterium]